MTTRGFKYLLGLMALLLAVGLACGSPTPTPAPPPTVAPVATEAASTSVGDQWTTFTDKNDYFAIDVPSDWTYSQEVDSTSSNWYWDKYLSPDQHAGVESIVYDDGTPWSSQDTGPTFRSWLHQFYSSTGQEGDIRISDDSIQKDGSERLTWESKGSDRSGYTFVEVRKPTAGLMFTAWWDNAYQDQYSDLLDKVIGSYRIP
ncbi:MAG TPA: hypothetical protein VIU38_04490 [Anaerolineales bacterium]